ncbi:MAG TPA: TatD family hydrolase, partial [Chthonomonadales bacterium]|nr:TatD family hydrolase [Chthonomonadales bacterium]
ALGEIGLDFHYDEPEPAAQYEPFQAQLRMASELDLPVIVHCRDAYSETLDLLERESVQQAVMHCWTGDRAQAERAMRVGLYLGFGGIITFKNASEVQGCAVAAPLERLLLETDSPYLAPAPYRGSRNEPAYTLHVARRLAELREMSLEDIERITEANARRCFPRLKDRSAP